MGHTGVQSSYESLPAPPELHDPDQESLLGSLKRFFVPSAPTPPPPYPPSSSTASTPQREASPARPPPKTTSHARDKAASSFPSAHQQLSALASAVRSKPTTITEEREEQGSSDPNASGITLPNGQKYTRRLRLSGVTPSVGVTVQNSDRGALISSTTSRSIATTPGGGGGTGDGWQAGPGSVTTGGGGGGTGEGAGFSSTGSPTTSEAFGGLSFKNLSSIPGFPLRGGDAGEDTKSAWSVSTTTHASPTVVQIFRRLQGEVSHFPLSDLCLLY